MKKEFKYSAEGAIIMYLDKYQILQQTDLTEYAKSQTTFSDKNPCNIYFILKRSRVTINPSSFKIYQDRFELEFEVHKQNERLKIPLKVGLPQAIKKLKLKSEYPYHIFEIYEGEKLGLRAKAAVYIDNLQREYPISSPELDFEVLYIGQSIGEDGKRTAIDRLGQHSTLQKIYSEAISQNPDSEIWLMLASFSQQNVAAINGTIKASRANEKEDVNRFLKFANNKYMTFTSQQKINFTEAALIRCFEPHYNDKYKNNFPDPTHTSYTECYNLDINALVIELFTGEMKRCLYTKKKTRELYQHETFYFQTDDDRWKLFHWD